MTRLRRWVAPGSLLRLIAPAVGGPVVAMAAFAWSRSLVVVPLVIAAAGWVAAQHDSNYRRVRGLDG